MCVFFTLARIPWEMDDAHYIGPKIIVRYELEIR